MSAVSCMRARDRPNRRAATAHAWRMCSVSGPRRLEWPRLCCRWKRSAIPRPSHPAARGAACDIPGPQAPDTGVDTPQTEPTRLGAAPSPDALLEMLTHFIRNEELRVWRPAVMTLRQPDLFLAQRFAMRRARILLIR